MKQDVIRLSNKLVIRKEYFGGILFNRDTGDVIEVDREAFTVISTLKDVEIVDMKVLLDLPISYRGRLICRERIKSVLSRFKDMGIIESMPKGVLSENYRKILDEKSLERLKWPEYQHLSAPETVHWAVTFQCGETCPDCYVKRHKRLFTQELDTQKALELIETIAANGVFQLAIGGGEPFVRNDLENIVRSAAEKGLIVHVTTGRYEIEKKRLDALKGYLKTLQIGIRTDELFEEGTHIVEKLKALVAQINERSIITGANIIMTKSSIYNLDRIIKILLSIGFKRFTLLRYKPPENVKRWCEEKPDKHEIDLLEERLTKIQEKYEGISFRIDCAFSFLERRLNPQKALYSGIRGCVAFDRILSVLPDGSVYPCSQLVGHVFNAGNLLNESFNDIWHSSTTVRKYRRFRTEKSFKTGSCGQCEAKVFCGGCRVFAEDAIGSDPGCPEHRDTDDGSDIIADIQDMIGSTGAGVPYAAREEIESWLEEDNDREYPSWINYKQG